jgi:hypothetical protein
MSLETDTEVEKMRRVQDGSGNDVPPANADEQARQADALANATSGFSDKFQPSTTGETAPSHPVADGKEVLFLADPGNGGVIYVGFGGSATVPLSKGNVITLQVINTDLVTAKAASSGDVLHVIGEETN